MSDAAKIHEEQPITQLCPVNVIIFPRGQLNQTDRNVLTAAGFLAVEADEPSRVVTVLPIAPIASALTGDEIFQSLLEAASKNASAGGDFGRALVLRMRNEKVAR